MRDTKIGKISKQWGGAGREFFTDLDYFGIKFPMTLGVYGKMGLLGACMLIVSGTIFKNYSRVSKKTLKIKKENLISGRSMLLEMIQFNTMNNLTAIST